MSEPTLSDVLRRLDTIDLELRAQNARLSLMETFFADFRREVTGRFDTLMDTIADLGRQLVEHKREGHQ